MSYIIIQLLHFVYIHMQVLLCCTVTFLCYQQLLKWPTSSNCSHWPHDCLLIVCLLLAKGDNSNTAVGRFTSSNVVKRAVIPDWAKAKWHMKLSLGVETPTTADEEEHQSSAVPQYLGHYWGLGSECYMVWWLHSFYKLQQWPAFSVIVVVRLGQSPFSPSLLSHCWNWTSIILSLSEKVLRKGNTSSTSCC